MKKIPITHFKKAMPVLLLVCISAFAYLLLIGKFGYYYDDWNLMYLARVSGAQIFHSVVSIDRPAMAYVMIPAYTLFGDNPLLYNISTYAFRLFGGLALLWLLGMLWPRQRSAITLVSLLFILYPGFLSQPNGIVYLTLQVSLFLACLSIALTVKAISTHHPVIKVFLVLLSIVLGWIYLSLVEFLIGLEGFRLLCLSHFVIKDKNIPIITKARLAITRWLPFASIPLVFLVWRVFLFDSTRKATDIGAQLGHLISSPLLTAVWWPVHLFTDSIKVTLLAWSVPLYRFLFELRLRDMLIGIGVAGIAAVITALVIHMINEAEEPKQEQVRDWRIESIWIGIVSVIFGLIPIILANRTIEFQNYSRYSLAASVGACMILVGLLYYLPHERARNYLAAILIFLAVFTHYANSVMHANWTDNVQKFWWQVAWRVPHIKSGTTLVADYPIAPIQEDYFVWGPASMIYYPEKNGHIPVQLKLAAVVLTQENIQNIILGRGEKEVLGRGNISIQNFRRVLILTQPSIESCVHILDGRFPELSIFEKEKIILVAAQSNVYNVEVNASPKTPDVFAFGPEPDHEWCYYYEKAELARQRGDWDSIVILGEEAINKGLRPVDRIEWLPFLQAYAYTDNTKRMRMIDTIISSEPFLQHQACQMLNGITDTLSPEVQTDTQKWFCGSDD